MRLLILITLLTACTVGTIGNTPTPPQTPPPTLPTLTPTLPTLTPTIDPTPTAQHSCNPKYSALIWVHTNMYVNPGLTVRMEVDGVEIILKPGRAVLLLETSGYAYRVVTADNERYDGWIPGWVLPVDCQ